MKLDRGKRWGTRQYNQAAICQSNVEASAGSRARRTTQRHRFPLTSPEAARLPESQRGPCISSVRYWLFKRMDTATTCWWHTQTNNCLLLSSVQGWNSGKHTRTIVDVKKGQFERAVIASPFWLLWLLKDDFWLGHTSADRIQHNWGDVYVFLCCNCCLDCLIVSSRKIPLAFLSSLRPLGFHLKCDCILSAHCG